MKLLPLLTSLLPLLSSVAGAKPKAKKTSYDTFLAKSKTNPAIKLDDASFDKLVAAPRNHTTAVLLTALDPRVGCKLCQDFQSEWQIIANTFRAADPHDDGRLLFGVLDFADGKNTFQSLQLQTAPVVMLYAPTVGPNVPEGNEKGPARFDFQSGGISAEAVHAWISRRLPESAPHPALRRPINYVRVVVLLVLLAGLITGAFVLYPYVWPLLSNRNLWAGVSLISVLLFTSGHMFNQIRGTPYITGDGKGGITYFAGGFQNQLGLESQVVAAIYGLLAISTIFLALQVPRIQDPRSQQIAAIAWVAVMYGTYSFLMSIFRIKNGGYPFGLPPF